MAVAAASTATAARTRLPGPDVVRGVALIGVVVLNYHGYLVLAGGSRGTGWAADLFDPWTGPLATRFAATFVLVAGVGVTLMTRSLDADEITSMRWTLVRRGALLYVVGLWLDAIWPGTILVYYGALFALAAALFTLRSRWLIVVGIGAALAGWALRAWRHSVESDGGDADWLFRPSGSWRFAFDVTVNGTHPLLPWLAFFCAGILLGRLLHHEWWRVAALAVGVTLFGLAVLARSGASSERGLIILSTDPGDRGIAYTASALGTALVGYACLDWAAERFPAATDPLRRAGQVTLSLYLLHVLVYVVVVRHLGWIRPAGLDVALTFALAFWVVAIALGVLWTSRIGRGPAERVYRSFGG